MILIAFSATEGKSLNVISAVDVEGTTIWGRDGAGLILKRPLAVRESIKGHRCSAGGYIRLMLSMGAGRESFTVDRRRRW
jgi:hypothetical protein